MPSTQPNAAAQPNAIEVDALVEPEMRSAVSALAGRSDLLHGMGRYHLGWVDQELREVDAAAVDRGKRIRPLIAVRCCEAAGGSAEQAAPLAAAIELLHNFTLVHDDIQDHSPTRRHRPTVWSLWGVAQAINAGDALFAAAHLALFELTKSGVPAEVVIELAASFDRMTIEIVAGQVLDLQFESRSDVMPDEYLEMISGKTAAIVEYAARSGAIVAGAATDTAARFAEFGRAVGIGFQVQDDLLGIWGESSETGKAKSDDIRRKKKSLPILLLRAAASPAQLDELDRIYVQETVSPEGVERVLELLAGLGIRTAVESHVRKYHDRATAALDLACDGSHHAAGEQLRQLVQRLATRTA